MLVEAGVFEVRQLGQRVQGPQGVQLEIAILELLIEVENGLEDRMLLSQYFFSCFLVAEHLAKEVVDPINNLTLLGLRCLEDCQKSLHFIKEILLEEEALGWRLDRQID